MTTSFIQPLLARGDDPSSVSFRGECQIEAARPPIAPNGTGINALALLPATNVSRDLAGTYTKDLATWTGLDTTKLSGAPTVRVMTSLFGMPQMTMTGSG